jgi:hypothetical protein
VIAALENCYIAFKVFEASGKKSCESCCDCWFVVQVLLIPLTMYGGVEKAFFGGDFTKVKSA